jgi:hypothetical protein
MGVIRFLGAEFTSHNNHEFLIISHATPFHLRLLFSSLLKGFNKILMSN